MNTPEIDNPKWSKRAWYGWLEMLAQSITTQEWVEKNNSIMLWEEGSFFSTKEKDSREDKWCEQEKSLWNKKISEVVERTVYKSQSVVRRIPTWIWICWGRPVNWYHWWIAISNLEPKKSFQTDYHAVVVGMVGKPECPYLNLQAFYWCFPYSCFSSGFSSEMESHAWYNIGGFLGTKNSDDHHFCANEMNYRVWHGFGEGQ